MGDEISRDLRDQLIEAARNMRSHPTEAEAHLWGFLRRSQLGGLRFRRQHVIRAFIVDFYCPDAKLVVEINGPVHLGQQEFDQAREAALVERGYRVLRFSNEEVFSDLDNVLAEIQTAGKQDS